MKFDHLRASIANNADQEPSLYMALCMVESLFADMETACGTELSQCPAGDERLSTKLVWLSRIIGEIYQDQDAQLQRNRSRLDGAMDKLSKTRQALEALSEAEKKLVDLRIEQEELDRRVREGEAAAKECETLLARCSEERTRLETLKSFDPTAAKEELKALTARAQALEEEKTSLYGQLEATRKRSESLYQDVDVLKAESEKTQGRIRWLSDQLQQAKDTGDVLRKELTASEEAYAALTAEQAKLAMKKEEKDAQVQAMQKQLNSFREDVLGPALHKLETVRRDVEALEKSKQEALQEYEGIVGRRNGLILDIARQKESNENQAESVKSAQSKLDSLKEEKHRLDGTLGSTLSQLETLQNEVEQLKNKKLPEMETLLQQEQLRRQDLDEKITGTQNRSTALKVEIADLQERLPKLEEDLKNDQVIYDALTANCIASSKELESMERQISELRSNNDREKLAIYRKQLEDNQQALEAVQAECAQIREENRQLLEQLEAGQNERARLLELKRKHESGGEATAKQLRELEFVATRDYARETAVIANRLELLEAVRSKLAASVGKLHRVLGNAPIDETVSLEEQLKTALRELKLRTDDLRSALIGCANSLKMEER